MTEVTKNDTILGTKDIISCLKSKGLSTEQAKVALETIIDLVRESVSSGNTVRIGGLGKFTKVYRAERKARNPHNRQEIIVVPGHWVAKFHPAKAMKELISSNSQ